MIAYTGLLNLPGRRSSDALCSCVSRIPALRIVGASHESAVAAASSYKLTTAARTQSGSLPLRTDSGSIAGAVYMRLPLGPVRNICLLQAFANRLNLIGTQYGGGIPILHNRVTELAAVYHR